MKKPKLLIRKKTAFLINGTGETEYVHKEEWNLILSSTLHKNQLQINQRPKAPKLISDKGESTLNRVDTG